LKSDSKTLKS